MTEEDNKEDLSKSVKRWRLMLGGGSCDGTGSALSAVELKIDACLSALYDAQLEEERQGKSRQAGLGASSPNVSRWLGDIRSYFPASVVKVMQKDALERLQIQRMLLEPELLACVEPDIHLVSTLLSLSSVIPNRTKDTARLVVRKVLNQLMQKLANQTRQAVSGAINRSSRKFRPRHNEIDWHRTIRANLKHYQKEYKTIVPEKRIGYGRRRSSLHDVILCVDQSGSMAASVVYASVFAAVLASIPALKTCLVVFDTAVVDLTEKLQDPVDVLFGTQLGGGTDINRAVTYCSRLIARPDKTVFILISDLYEGGNNVEMLKTMARIKASGVNCVTLLALNDSGAPVFDHNNAAALASLEIPSFACTPDLFPDLIASALSNQDIQQWAAKHDLFASRART